MKQITRITIALAFIISLASCQSSKSGCYDFGEVSPKVTKIDGANLSSSTVFTSIICKP